MTVLFLYFTLAFSDGRWTQLGPFPTLAICQERMAPFERAQAGEAVFGVSQCYGKPTATGAGRDPALDQPSQT